MAISTDSREWPLWWRIWSFANLCFFVMMGNWYLASISPIILLLSQYFHVSFDAINHSITYPLLTVGLGNFFAVPVSYYIGKRLLIIVSLTLFMGCNIWCAFETNSKAFEVARILGGLSAGVPEALGPLLAEELFHEQHLATAMACYSLTLGVGTSFGPLITGALIRDGHDWHWTFKVIACLLGLNLLSVLIMCPESIPIHASDSLVHETATGTHAEDNAEKGQESTFRDHISTGEATPSSSQDGLNESHMAVWRKRSFFLKPPLDERKSNIAYNFLHPLTSVFGPSVLLTSIVFGLNISFTLVASIVLSNTLQSPPHLWTPYQIGLLNLSAVTGLVIGMPFGGPLADWLFRRATRTSETPRWRESRLPAVLPGAILGPVGSIIVGVCLQKDKIWFGLAAGWTLMNVALTSMASVSLTYCVDCYPWRTIDIGVMVNVLKNIIAFGVAYGVQPWLEAVGPQKQFGTMAGIFWAFAILYIPLWMFGPRIREVSERWL